MTKLSRWFKAKCVLEWKEDTSIEAEGQFGKPELKVSLLTNYNQVRSSCSYGFKVPAPLSDAKQASYNKNVEAAGLNMLRKAMGASMTLKFC